MATRRASSAWSPARRAADPRTRQSALRQSPGRVESGPPAPVGGSGVDHHRAALLAERLAVVAGAGERERAESQGDVARGDRPGELDLDLGAVVDEAPQGGCDR